MPYGVVLLPDRRTHDRLARLAAVTVGPAPQNTLGDHAPAHVSVAHFEADPERAAGIAARVAAHPAPATSVKIIGLLYAVLPPGDYYVPRGGVYFGIEVVRRPALDALHTEVLGWIGEAGGSTLGAVGADYRPHVTLGVSSGRPVLPEPAEVPVGELDVTLAFGELGPYGTFPGLRPTG
ncbi:hypothetical protein ACPCHT_00485 [Nucisporomicrobium flavum]|uniref:hypothetical protein n=1 Tax=Nucisporomicrobium flavum TaxID=2785915 RepID=UPI003C2B232C